MEAAIGIEPMDKGFADLCLTTWLRRLNCQTKGEGRSCWLLETRPSPENLERETGFEPATSTLARSHSTAELLPLGEMILSVRNSFCQPNALRKRFCGTADERCLRVADQAQISETTPG